MKINKLANAHQPQSPESVFQFSMKNPTVIEKFVQPVRDLVIPQFVTRIAKGAFSNYTPIRHVQSIKVENPNLRGITELVRNVPDEVDIEVPDDFADMKALYLALSPDRRASVSQMLRDDLGLVVLHGHLVNYVGDGGDVIIPDSVTSIDKRAFVRCTSLTSVTIPDSVTSIGDEAFWYCTSLESVTIGSSVRSIGYDAFYGCTSLTSVTIGNSVTSIGEYAFGDCHALASVTIPDSVKSIGEWAFFRCASLTSITIGDSVTEIGRYAFEDCTALTSVMIPDSVRSIGDNAFYGCTSLTVITDNPRVQEFCEAENIPWQPDSTITTM